MIGYTFLFRSQNKIYLNKYPSRSINTRPFSSNSNGYFPLNIEWSIEFGSAVNVDIVVV